MATLLRFSRPGRAIFSRLSQCQGPASTVRCVSTTKRANDLISSNLETTIDKSKELETLEKHFADTNPDNLKNWVSEGFDLKDRDMDRFMSGLTWFLFASVMFVGVHFILYYAPDMHMRDWASREAYLDMDRRKKAGLPLIDPYYVHPDQITLPTEGEIGDQEIVM